MNRPRVAAAALAAVLTAGCAAGSTSTQPGTERSGDELETVTVTIGAAPPLVVEIADDEAKRQRGLMNRERLDPGTGMIFVFPSAREGSFWMYQTLIPLSIAWAADGQVIGIAEMEPCPSADPAQCPRYTAPAAFDLAIEAPAGTFTDAGVRAGDQVQIDGELPTPSD